MKQPVDTVTPDMLDQSKAKRGRGRPRTGEAQTDVERAAAYRARQREAGLVKRYVPAKGPVGALSDFLAPLAVGDSLGKLEAKVALLNAHVGILWKQLQDARTEIDRLTSQI